MKLLLNIQGSDDGPTFEEPEDEPENEIIDTNVDDTNNNGSDNEDADSNADDISAQCLKFLKKINYPKNAHKINRKPHK